MNPEVVSRFIENLGPAFEAGDALAAGKQAERDNVACIRQMYEAISRGDYEGLRGLLTEDLELEIAGAPELPVSGSARGINESLALAGRNYAQLEDERPEILSLVAQGDTVAVIARERGRLRATGREYDVLFTHLFTFRDGRIARIFGFCDSASMLEAARPVAMEPTAD